jgi:hypothetical protein
MATKTPLVCVLSLDQICRLIHGTASAVSLEMAAYPVQVSHQPFENFGARGSIANNALRSVSTDTGLVTLEHNEDAYQRRLNLLNKKYIDDFNSMVSLGPDHVKKYLIWLEHTRTTAISGMHDFTCQIRRNNLKTSLFYADMMVVATSVKAASTIFVEGAAVYLLIAGGATIAVIEKAGAVAFSYSVAGALVGHWDELGNADAIVITTKEVAKEFGKEKAAETVANHMEKVAAEKLAKSSAMTKLVEQAEGWVALQSRRLQEAVRAGRGVAKAEGRAATTAQTLAARQAEKRWAEGLAKAAKFGGKALPVVFTALDIFKDLHDVDEALNERREILSQLNEAE